MYTVMEYLEIEYVLTKYFLWLFSLLLIEEGRLSVSGERICTNTDYM